MTIHHLWGVNSPANQKKEKREMKTATKNTQAEFEFGEAARHRATIAAQAYVAAYRAARTARVEQEKAEAKLSKEMSRYGIDKILLPGGEQLSIRTEIRYGGVSFDFLVKHLGEDEARELWEERPRVTKLRLRANIPNTPTQDPDSDEEDNS
jgi:hypothetical protein